MEEVVRTSSGGLLAPLSQFRGRVSHQGSADTVGRSCTVDSIRRRGSPVYFMPFALWYWYASHADLNFGGAALRTAFPVEVFFSVSR